MMTLFFLVFAFLMSFGAVRSVFEPVETTIARIRESSPWSFRASQIFCLVCLLAVQSTLFGNFGSASFSGLSLLLYLVILWETAWIALLWGGGGLDFLSRNLAIAVLVKVFSAGQGLLLMTLIVGWFGFGPAASEFITGATAQKALTQNGPALKSFTGHWRRLLSAGSGQTEEFLDAHVNGKNFAIVKKIGALQRSEIHFNGTLTEIINIVGSDQRKVSTSEAIPAMLRRQMFWIASGDLAKAADQSNPPGTRAMTLFAGEEPAGFSLKEWVDDETGIVLHRERRFGENAEILEFVGLETVPVPESAFDPARY